jgi:hypothetical protein
MRMADDLRTRIHKVIVHMSYEELETLSWYLIMEGFM